MSVVFVDLEMKPVSNDLPEKRAIAPMETIEFGAVKLNGTDETDAFCRLVKPVFGPIPPRYEALTGITNEAVENAEPYAAVFSAFIEWCTDAETIYAWSPSDLTQLRRDAALHPEAPSPAPLAERWDDYQRIFTEKLGLHRELSLKQAAEIVGLNMEGQLHDALWDARNTAALYRLAADPVRWKEKTGGLKKTVNNDKPVTYSLADLFAGWNKD